MTPLTAHLVLDTVIFKAALLLFWAALALLSALQLSIFGTWLPQHTTGSALLLTFTGREAAASAHSCR